MTVVSGQGLSFQAPAGWEAIIYRRPEDDGESTHAVLHAATFALPSQRGDYGSGAVERMTAGDVFVALLEFHPDASSSALFARAGLPSSLDPSAFSPFSLQRRLPGQAGWQSFFSQSGRAFCLYVVLGAYAARGRLVPRANQAVAGIGIHG